MCVSLDQYFYFFEPRFICLAGGSDELVSEVRGGLWRSPPLPPESCGLSCSKLPGLCPDFVLPLLECLAFT